MSFIYYTIQHKIPNLNNFEECKIDYDFRKHTRTKYPGACSLEYQQVIQIFIDCMLQWDSKKQEPKGRGILGRVIAFAPAHEEQGRRTLHSHWQVWVEDLSPQIREDLFSPDDERRNKTRAAFYRYVDNVMCATYSKPLSFDHNCMKASNKTSGDFVILNHNQRDPTMCDNMDEDIPPLAARVEDLEDDCDHDENFGISVGDRENDVMCDNNEIVENGGYDITSENDTINAIACDDDIDNEKENVGISVGDRENDTSRMKFLNIISTSPQHTECLEDVNRIRNINSSRKDDIEFDGELVDVAGTISRDNDDPMTDDFLQTHQFSKAISYSQFSKTISPDRNDIIFDTEITLHEIGSHCFIEKELQLFRDARHESLCYNDNGKMIRCNMCQQDFSPVDLVDNTIKKKVVEFGGVRQETPQFVSHHRFLRTNLFTDYLNFIRFKFLLFCSPVNQVAFKQCQKNNLMSQRILTRIISYMKITRHVKKLSIHSGEMKM